MYRPLRFPLAAAVAVSLSACDLVTGPSQNPSSLDSGFATMLLGFDNVESSFSANLDGGQSAWAPSGRGERGPGGGGMCGGGLRDGFGIGFGLGAGGFRLPADCAFTAASGRVICPAVTRNGLTINRSASFATANGTVQSAYDSATTNTVNMRVSVSGTTTRRDSSSTLVSHESNRTVSGLAAGSTQRTVNGTSAGMETTNNGRNRNGTYAAVRVMGDTITNVVIPAQSGAFPTSGTIVRAMRVTLTYTGQAAATSTRREVITFNGTSTADVVITRDGVTQSCTLPLPRGRLSCE